MVPHRLPQAPGEDSWREKADGGYTERLVFWAKEGRDERSSGLRDPKIVAWLQANQGMKT